MVNERYWHHRLQRTSSKHRRALSILLAVVLFAGGNAPLLADNASLATTAAATPGSDSLAREKLIRILQPLRSYSASFYQVVRDDSGKELEHFRGSIKIMKPDKMAWYANEPLSQTVISDGVQFWYYDADLEQLTIQKADDRLAHSPAMILGGDAATLGEHYEVSELASDSSGSEIFSLVPRQAGSLFDRLEMHFDGAVLHRLVMLDGLQQHTEITFSNVVINPVLAESEFSFTAPAGTDIIDER